MKHLAALLTALSVAAVYSMPATADGVDGSASLTSPGAGTYRVGTQLHFVSQHQVKWFTTPNTWATCSYTFQSGVWSTSQTIWVEHHTQDMRERFIGASGELDYSETLDWTTGAPPPYTDWICFAQTYGKTNASTGTFLDDRTHIWVTF